jgi:hypothetical protein
LTQSGHSRLRYGCQRHSLVDLPLVHIRRSQRCFKLMQRDARLASKVKPTGGWTLAVALEDRNPPARCMLTARR